MNTLHKTKEIKINYLIKILQNKYKIMNAIKQEFTAQSKYL